MANKRWTARDNKDRLVTGAQTMVAALTETYPALAPFETPLVKAMYDISRIVGNHAASFGDDDDVPPERDNLVEGTRQGVGEEVDDPPPFTLYGVFEIPLVA